MIRSFPQIIVITIMLTAFIGQSFAYTTMVCEMADDMHQGKMTDRSLPIESATDVKRFPLIHHNAKAAHADKLLADKPHHSVTASEVETAIEQPLQSQESKSPSKSMPCCDIKCECPANACMSASLLPFDSYGIIPVNTTLQITASVQPLINFYRNSLYRPPIIA